MYVELICHIHPNHELFSLMVGKLVLYHITSLQYIPWARTNVLAVKNRFRRCTAQRCHKHEMETPDDNMKNFMKKLKSFCERTRGLNNEGPQAAIELQHDSNLQSGHKDPTISWHHYTTRFDYIAKIYVILPGHIRIISIQYYCMQEPSPITELVRFLWMAKI